MHQPLKPEASRIVSLDAMRGVAILGIIVMNVLFFTMPTTAYFNPRAWGGTDIVNQAAWAVSFVLVEDKMRNLFAMLFGAGVLLMLGKMPGRESEASKLPRHYVRMGWLLVIGFAHAIVLANNDILRVYAVAGLLLPLFVNLPTRLLLLIVVIFILLQLLLGSFYGLPWLTLYLDADAPARLERLAPAETIFFGADPKRIADELALQAGPYGDIIMRRASNVAGVTRYILAALPTTLAAMLTGMALLKSGFLTGSWTGKSYRKILLASLIFGLLPLIGLAYAAIASDYHAIVITGNALIWSAPFDLILAIGWAALVMMIIAQAKSGLGKAITAAGRMALTNYLLTSLTMGFVFFSYGLGLFGSVSRIGAIGIAFAMMALILIWSPLWLARFPQGPAEWAWRRLVQLTIGSKATT